MASSSSRGCLHASLPTSSALLNGMLLGVASQMGRSLMLTEMKSSGSVPVGSAAFVKAHLAKKRKRILCDFVLIDPLLNLGRWPHPDVPARQMLRILALACLQLMDDYWIRYIHPDYTLKFAESIDVQRLFQMSLGADTHSWSEHTQYHQGGGMAPPSCHHRGHLAVIDDNGGGDASVIVITILIHMLCGREEEAGENTGGGAGGGRPRQPGRRVQHSIVCIAPFRQSDSGGVNDDDREQGWREHQCMLWQRRWWLKQRWQ